MMTRTLQVFMLAAVVVYFIFLFRLLRQNKLNLKYSLLWIISGIIMLILAVFPRLLDFFSGIVGIFSPVNALFAVLFFCGIIILISLTAIVSALNERIKRMTQTIALLENRLRQMEQEKWT